MGAEKVLWVAMILKTKLKDCADMQYIATTMATTQSEAVHNIASMQWGEHYWVEGKSVTIIQTIYPALDPKLMALSLEPVRRRRRRS